MDFGGEDQEVALDLVNQVWAKAPGHKSVGRGRADPMPTSLAGKAGDAALEQLQSQGLVTPHVPHIPYFVQRKAQHSTLCAPPFCHACACRLSGPRRSATPTSSSTGARRLARSSISMNGWVWAPCRGVGTTKRG
eukprot:255567-Chlamydomonas_euryale.AAC.1